MASLLRAITNMFRAQKDQAAEALSDPVRDAKYDIEDAKNQIRNFESKIASLMAANITSVKNQQSQEREVTKWGNVAAEAAKSGNREDTARAVVNKQNAEAQVATFKSEIGKNEKTLTALRNDLTKARSVIGKAEANKVQLAARLEGAKVRRELSGGLSFDDGPLARLDALEQKVVAAESEAEAYESLRTDDNVDLADKYSSAGSASIDDEVNSLMAAAGK